MDRGIIKEFRAVVGDHEVITGPEQLRTYECDALISEWHLLQGEQQ